MMDRNEKPKNTMKKGIQRGLYPVNIRLAITPVKRRGKKLIKLLLMRSMEPSLTRIW
jgi:hypothetical protein